MSPEENKNKKKKTRRTEKKNQTQVSPKKDPKHYKKKGKLKCKDDDKAFENRLSY